MAPKGHLDRAHRLQSLGIIYYNKYKRIGTTADLELAVERFQEAVELTPNTPLHPTWIEKSFVRASRLDSLGAAYRERYIGTGAIADLDTAIQHFQEAVDITGSDHRHSYRLQALGAVHGDRYLKTGAAVDLATAIQLYEKALDEDFSPFLDRLRSARSLFPFYAKTNSWALAHQAASRATYLVPFLTSRCLSTFGKQHLLTEVAGLSCDAVAFALMAEEKPCEAIRLLELGRGVIVSSLGELRVDTYYLQQKDQRLAEKYNHARDQLDTSIYLTRQIDQRYAATILEIRKLPGFDRFLLAPSEDELKVAAIPGPIVVINASEYRCDALVVEKDGLRAIRLPDLHSSDIRDRAKTLVNPDLISDLLEWLWYTTVSPVLDALGFTEPSPSCWPRVWWVPTGLLTKFPLHAAGLYSKRSSDTALDRVISSYSSSIQALLQSRQKGPAVSVVQGSEKAVLVGMEKTPGHRDLRFVPQEMTTLKSLCDIMQLQVIEPLACREDVLDALQNCKVFHFAGHGLTDALDPSNSSLLLSDGTLTVAKLLETNLHSRTPFLAYLSACGTGRLKNEMLIDESLHLISAFQLAGFRHVIGTLWEVHDRSCVDVTTMVYEWMRGQNMSDESVSESLHHASRKLRSQWIAENDIRTSKHQTGIRKKDDQMATEQSHLSQEVVREPRDVVPCEDTPPYWVPFVHFGV
ncbi:CHAT domain-containing protein [Xylaria arbuscula]|nr:CHAT domain-containing protein [Xylaria arbuscula]